MINAQEWLDKEYPKDQRKNTINLNIKEKELEDTLDLSEFVNLEELDCSNNQLTELRINNCPNLEMLACYDNYLTELDLSKNFKLEALNIADNNFSEQDLSFLNSLTSLETVVVGNRDEKRIQKGFYNRFIGSLKHLEKLTRLECLDIRNSDISEGLEYLPENLEEFICLSKERTEAKVRKIYNFFANEKGIVEVDNFGLIKDLGEKVKKKIEEKKKSAKDVVKDWKEIHPDFTEELQKEWKSWGFTPQTAREWIKLGFEPRGLDEVEKWKNLNFSLTETKAWLKVGLDKDEGEFASWLRTNNHIPELVENNLKQLRNDIRYGFCKKCKEINTSEKWCQPCAEQEWKQLSGRELINKFIEQQGKDSWGKDNLPWIPYKEFTDIKHLADGGFSKIYTAKWKREKSWDESDYVVLKSLNNSQNITLEFLTEIANTKLVEGVFSSGYVVKCYGISQDPTTKNYLMVMEYMKEGNLRQYLQNNKLSLVDKLWKLSNIAKGLSNIHEQKLLHQDFHSGNILNRGEYNNSSIADLGLSRPVNHLKQEGKIFGVLPYVAPEVLRGEPYTQASDVYSFGIIAYELLANSYPYGDLFNDEFLAVEICQGLRPDIDKIPLSQEVKDLIKNCWDTNLEQRPNAEELWGIIDNWIKEIKDKKNTPFYQQYLEIEAEYNIFSENTPYQIHSNAITTSKMIDTKTITQQLKFYSKSLAMDFTNLKIEDKLQTNIEIPPYGNASSSRK